MVIIGAINRAVDSVAIVHLDSDQRTVRWVGDQSTHENFMKIQKKFRQYYFYFFSEFSWNLYRHRFGINDAFFENADGHFVKNAIKTHQVLKVLPFNVWIDNKERWRPGWKTVHLLHLTKKNIHDIIPIYFLHGLNSAVNQSHFPSTLTWKNEILRPKNILRHTACFSLTLYIPCPSVCLRPSGRPKIRFHHWNSGSVITFG